MSQPQANVISLVPKPVQRALTGTEACLAALAHAREEIEKIAADGREPQVVICYIETHKKGDADAMCSGVICDENTNPLEAEGIVQVCMRDYWG